MSTYLITGASRGLGLEFVKQILEKQTGSKVIAAARKPTENKQLVELQKKHPQNLTLIVLDVTNTDSVNAAAQQITKSHPQGIDYILNNAGIMGPDNSNPDDFTTYNTNVSGPLRVIHAFLPLLKKGNKKVVLNISSLMGSVASQSGVYDFLANLAPGVDCLNYRISKAALNAAVTALAAEYKKDGITFVSIHPGLVSTDMVEKMNGNVPALKSHSITPDVAVDHVLTILHKLTLEDSPKFYNHDGTTIPW